MADEFTSWRNLDSELGNMLENFSNLVKAARIPEETVDDVSGREKKVPGDLLEVWAEKLLFSAYMCHHHISELKKGAALSDFESQIAEGRKVRTDMDSADAKLASELANIKLEAQLLLRQLECSYYGSALRGKPTTPSISEQLRQLCQLAMEAQPTT